MDHHHTGRRLRRLGAGVAVLALAGVPVASGDDRDDAASDTTETTASTETTETTEAGSEVVEVTLADYEFQGLPEEVPAGTRLQVSNESTMELHELVAFRLPDDEERSVEELLQLPEEEQMALVGGGEPDTVLLAMPGSDEQIEAVGDGTLGEPGRYLIACFIPTGADPQEYMSPAQEAEGGPPEVAGGPPHFVQGMWAELRVV